MINVDFHCDATPIAYLTDLPNDMLNGATNNRLKGNKVCIFNGLSYQIATILKFE